MLTLLCIGGPNTTKNFSDGYILIFTLNMGFSRQNIHHTIFFADSRLSGSLLNVRKNTPKKKHFLRKDLDFKISKTKLITKEPSLVYWLFFNNTIYKLTVK